MATTARQRMVAGFGTMMAAYIVANPTLLRRHYPQRPPKLVQDLPLSYVSIRPESVSYSSGLQDRVLSPSLVVVDQWTVNDETVSRADVLVDSLVDYIGGYGGSFGGHITNDSVWSRMTITEGTEQDGETSLWAVRFDFPDLLFSEGR